MKLGKIFGILFALLLMAGLLSAGQTVFAYNSGDIPGTTGSGTKTDPVVVDTFAEFKAAMESFDISAVKLTGSSDEVLPEQTELDAAIIVYGPLNRKQLTIEGKTEFWAPAGNKGYYDCLLYVGEATTLTVNGNGKLVFHSRLNNGINAVIWNEGTCSVSGVNLDGNINTAVYGYAIVNRANGNLTINSGSFSGVTAFDDTGPFAAVRIDSGKATIYGGMFSSTIANGETVTAGTNALAIRENASCTVYGGTFTSGILVKGSPISSILADNCIMVDSYNNLIPLEQNRYNGSATVVSSIINSVNVKISEPVAGQTPKNAVSVTPSVTIRTTEWTCGGSKLSSTDKFEEGKTYRVVVVVDSNSGYTFSVKPTVTFNGSNAGTIALNGTNYIKYYADYSVPRAAIGAVNVSIQEPIAGQSPQDAVSTTSNVSVSVTEWYDGDHNLTSTDTFEAGATYKVHVIVNSNNDFTFETNPKVTFNGSIAGTIFLSGPTYINYYTEFTVPAGPITSVSLTIPEPKAGAKPSYTLGLPSGVHYYSGSYSQNSFKNDIRWDDTDGTPMTPDSDTFVAGHQYKITIFLSPENGYEFDGTVTATINGNTVRADVYGYQLLLTYTFPAIAISWGSPTYTWSSDYKTVTATRVSQSDSTKKETETVNTTSAVTKAATCTAKGTTTYTATFKNTAFTKQTKAVENIAALGHSWDAGKVTKEPTTTATGVMTYTCQRCGATKTETIPKLAGVLIGDVNQDGSVDATDRMILSRYLAKWDGYAAKIKSMDAADIDRNGLVEAKDRMILARYLAKWTGYESYFK